MISIVACFASGFIVENSEKALYMWIFRSWGGGVNKLLASRTLTPGGRRVFFRWFLRGGIALP